MTRIPDDDIKRMLAEAEKATPGPWLALSEEYDEQVMDVTTQDRIDNSMVSIASVGVGYDGPLSVEQPANARHIANLNPAVAISLLTELLERRAVMELIREEATKSNAPLGRSDSLVLSRIRAVLSPEA